MNDHHASQSLQELGDLSWFRRFAKIMVVILILFSLAMMFVPWQQTALGQGKVIAYSPTDRQQSISATVEGRIGQWYVHEGSHVKKGDRIVKIMDIDPDLLKRLHIEKNAVELRLKSTAHSVKISEANVERQRILFEKGINSKRQYELARVEYNKLVNENASAKVALAKIKTRLSRQHSQMVVAPTSGTILRRISGQESVIVKPGLSLATLVPDTNSRAVELWLDGNDIPLVEEGEEVRLQFEGWPAIQFSGWPSVSVGTFGAIVALVDAADDGHGNFRILVIPKKRDDWPEKRYLRQGVRVHGWVMLGRVKLGYELWRKFNGFPPKSPNPPKFHAGRKVK